MMNPFLAAFVANKSAFPKKFLNLTVAMLFIELVY